MPSFLLDQIAQHRPGICLYGLAPPKSSTAPDQLAQIAAQQMERLRALDIDGVIVYDIQEEAERTSQPRPFPFLPTFSPAEYAHVHLGSLALPKVVYRCVAGDTRESFVDWFRPRSDSTASRCWSALRAAMPRWGSACERRTL
jgi:hypothetical protein